MNKIPAGAFSDQRDGGDGNAFIGDPDAKLIANLVDCLDQPRGDATNLVACLLRNLVDRIAGAIEQAKPSVTVRTSRCSISVIATVCRISA